MLGNRDVGGKRRSSELTQVDTHGRLLRRHARTGEVSSICVLTAVHMDGKSRKSTAFPAEFIARIKAFADVPCANVLAYLRPIALNIIGEINRSTALNRRIKGCAR